MIRTKHPTRQTGRVKMTWRAALAAALVLLTSCGGDDDEPPGDPDRVVLAPEAPGDGHTHAVDGAGATVGDGTSSSVAGYTLTDVRLPRPGEPGDLSFRILDASGEPLLSYAEEQTKLLHLYVVRNDLQDFRHLHPTMAQDGTWTARVNLAGPGSYRVLTEFTPGDDPEGRHVVLGRTDIVPGTWSPEQVAVSSSGDNGVIQVTAPETVAAGPDQRMTLTVEGSDGGAPELGTYLGTFSHLTGFEVESGAFTHAHPYGEPVPGEDGTELTFHTEFEKPGRYVFFVQVRVDGFVHTVPVSTTVS